MSVQIDGSTGNIIATKADYSGDVSIGGTLTYEDVTNIDSVGLITARNGIKVDDLGVQVGTGATIDGATNTLTFLTNGSERIRVTSDGNIGIGNINPGDFRSGAENLVIGSGSGAEGMTIYSATNASGRICFADGSGASDEERGVIQYAHDDNHMQFDTNAAERLRIDSSGRLLFGHSSSRDVANVAQPNIQIEGTSVSTSTLSIARNSNDAGGPVLALSKTRGTSTGSSTVVQSGDTAGAIYFSGADGTDVNSYAAWIEAEIDSTPGGNDMPGRLVFSTTADGAVTPTERLRITSGGKIQVTGTRGGSLQPSDNDSLELFTSASNGAVDTGCGMSFYNNDGNGAEIGGTIQVAKENGNINNTAGYMRFCTRPNASDVAERMRIGSGGDVLISRTSASISNIGHYFLSVGAFNHTRSGDTVGEINRLANDGTLINFRQADSVEGSISVSGSSVSYNGGHLARWSQLPNGAARTEILRGSVLSNLDEMCEWGEEDNEQLNRMKVSDVEGDINVSGVFQAWDDDDDTYTNDFYCAMTGDFVIRIASGVTVQRGNLLMSAGDGTAKPQGDGYIQDKTIAKVTSTTRSVTYSDGSYCVPCVLMAC